MIQTHCIKYLIKFFMGLNYTKNYFILIQSFLCSGLIEHDEVILSNSLIELLQNRFNSKIAMVTGRGKESVRYSLKNLLTKFDLKNSLFLEDESRELAKPNPKPLLNSIKGMNSKFTLYVGDSMEDFIMAKKVTTLGYPSIFCGITGTSKNPQEKLELFEQNGAILVLNSINGSSEGLKFRIKRIT